MCNENRIPMAVLCSIPGSEHAVEEGWQCCNHFTGAVGTAGPGRPSESVQPCTGHLHFCCVSFWEWGGITWGILVTWIPAAADVSSLSAAVAGDGNASDGNRNVPDGGEKAAAAPVSVPRWKSSSLSGLQRHNCSHLKSCCCWVSTSSPFQQYQREVICGWMSGVTCLQQQIGGTWAGCLTQTGSLCCWIKRQKTYVGYIQRLKCVWACKTLNILLKTSPTSSHVGHN